jgi:hypothetical protein
LEAKKIYEKEKADYEEKWGPIEKRKVTRRVK